MKKVWKSIKPHILHLVTFIVFLSWIQKQQETVIKMKRKNRKLWSKSSNLVGSIIIKKFTPYIQANCLQSILFKSASTSDQILFWRFGQNLVKNWYVAWPGIIYKTSTGLICPSVKCLIAFEQILDQLLKTCLIMNNFASPFSLLF